jgi:N-acetylated-alpha-linked acidic dipeptidase
MIRPASIRTGAALAASLVGLAPGTTAQQPVRGFPAGALPALRAREAAVQAVPATDSLSALMRRLTARPHMAGTPASREVAETMLARWRSYGLDARIEQFEAMMPVPTSQVVELLGPRRHIAVVREPALTEDPDTGHPEHLPAFAAYSADGDATGEVVYVNYGQLEDYRLLDSMGVDLRGRIVLSRAGGMPQPRWRLAAERGATAVIVYHDPRDEGFYHGDTYPDGPRRPAYGIATASIADWGEQSRTQAAAGASLIQATAYPPIPVVPISERDALPFLRGLTGPVAPPAWRGGLPVTYRLGGTGPVRARVSVRSERRLRPLYNVTARIPGALSEDQWVLLGNHHDAWGPGADDPIAGLVALDEAARALATLLRDGWRPARTIVLIAWDGEEWGLLGSKSWVERHAADLRERAVAYLNGDNVQRGWFRAQGPPSLQTFVSELIRDLADPVRGASVLEAWQRGPGAAQPGGPEPAGRPPVRGRSPWHRSA